MAMQFIDKKLTLPEGAWVFTGGAVFAVGQG